MFYFEWVTNKKWEIILKIRQETAENKEKNLLIRGK